MSAVRRLRLPSNHAALDELLLAVEAFTEEHGCGEDVAYKTQLLASEAATNAIEHAHELDEKLMVEVELHAKPFGVVLIVQDEGPGFDPYAPPDPRGGEHLLANSGRGLFLIRQMGDAVRFEDDGRRVIIEIREEAA